MFYDNPPLSCDMSVPAWIFLGTILTLLKLITAVGQANLYYLREKKFRERNIRHKRRKIPLVPVFSFIILIVYILAFVLPSYNIASAKNGLPAFFFGFGWIFFGLLSIIFLLKFVHLGYQIVPSKARVYARQNSDELNRLDGRGKISLGLSLFALAGQAIMLCIFALAIPNNYTILRIGYGFQAWFCAQHGLTMVIHFERIKSAIRATRDANIANISQTKSRDLTIVLKKLTEQEMVVAMANVFAVGYYLSLCAYAFATRYFVFTVALWTESLNFLLIMASNYKALLRTAKGSSSASSNVHNKRGTDEAGIVPVEAADLPDEINGGTKFSSKDNVDGDATPMRMQSELVQEAPVAAYMRSVNANEEDDGSRT